jgi:hypothetical protein
VDYDYLYTMAIRPAAEMAGCNVVRADEESGGIIHKSILRLVISSDVFIADLGGNNPNVMYEVGVRHASRRGVAILLSEGGSRVPFNISYSRVLSYEVDDSGRVTEKSVERLRNLLSSAIQEGLVRERNDSPVFEFFPGYHVELPRDLKTGQARSRPYSPELQQLLTRTGSSPRQQAEAAKSAEEIVKATSEHDPAAALEVVKKYRDLSAWDELIRFTDELSPAVKDSAQIQQILALALNRRNHSGDRDRAVALMEQLIGKTGGDGETHGILGRIYKDRFAVTGDNTDMERAIAHYRAGFAKEPSDYYPGVNLVNLLMIYGGDAGKQELATVLPRVRQALATRMDPERSEYWELATALHLAAIAGDWDEAHDFAGRITRQLPARWMLESTVGELKRLEQAMEGTDLDNLRSIEETLLGALLSREERNA